MTKRLFYAYWCKKHFQTNKILWSTFFGVKTRSFHNPPFADVLKTVTKTPHKDRTKTPLNNRGARGP